MVFILLLLPADFKVGFFLELISVFCRWCQIGFCVCRCCWRGQAYCCDACRLSASRASHRKAQRRYRQTEKGRRAHQKAENRRRHSKNPSHQKNMDDASSTPSVCRYKVAAKKESGAMNMPFGQGYCHFCGRSGVIVSRFPRKGYGKRRFETVSHYG
jgi:hypothetical protein